MTETYRVELDVFQGPLDLLLYLVRRQEVDVVEMPIAVITEQFLEFLEVLQVLDFDMIGDFVVLASTLVELKSRLVLPQPEQIEAELATDADPRTELVHQLLEYKRFKDAARLLQDQSAQWRERYPRLNDDRPHTGGDPSQDRIKEVELWDLVSALSRVLRSNTETAPTSIVYDDTPISVYIERIRDRVLTEKRVPFTAFFAGTNMRSKIVGIFLAMLELLRHYQFRAEQPTAYGEIWVLPPRTTSFNPEPTATASPDELASSPLAPGQTTEESA